MSEERSQPHDIGGPARNRNISEGSAASDDGMTSGFAGKRKPFLVVASTGRERTTSQTLPVASGLTAASPPKFVSWEEIMQAANGMRDMNLVHQIAVDENFRLEKAEPEPNTLQKVIKDTMHRAFWDILRQQLAEDPPSYNQAFVLLEEIKQNLNDLLLSQHTKTKQQISEILDIPLIKQQAEKGILDFTTLELMHLDTANFTLRLIRPDIINHSVELERAKFAKFLEVQADGLEQTRKWLLRHIQADQPVPTDVEYETFIRSCSKRAFTLACIDLLEWDRSNPYPETLILDEERLRDVQTRTFRLVAIATVLLVTLANAGDDLQFVSSFKQVLKDRISILLANVKSDDDLKEALPNIIEQVIKDVREAQQKYDLPQLGAAKESALKDLLMDIGREGHKVRGIVRQRIKDFFLNIIESATAAPQKVPTGLTAFQSDLTGIAGEFLRIVSHNSSVFCIWYFNIVSAVLPKP
ncbi:T-complex protein 11-like protein 1 isoform X3 [Dendroctonus ponderosae]|uniref:T-complex protein 11-like protein 1 isoform X3 n=1 Tax=Dendroctonus ponderosae TaxID=77166 RepID=UPI002036075A|nr:T-complex protein 11-like protein 1 isoform X3 [Dendroctonus ponderosae]